MGKEHSGRATLLERRPSLKRVHVLVEGQTEEAFIGRSVRPHLLAFNVHVSPKLVVTRRVVSGPDRKGGVTSWGQIERDARLLLHDTDATAITTLLDYYGLPADVPGMSSRPSAPAAAALHVEGVINERLADFRFHAHLSLHEFEALLYSDPDVCGRYLDAPSVTSAMVEAVSRCGTPELVNDDPNTAPSKRLLTAFPSYRKTLDGPALAELIGLAAIRSVCPHFDGWMTWLESLGD
jgi:hypothetical protein